MADEELDGTDVVSQFLGERQRVAHQTRNALSQGIVEVFNVIGFAGFLPYSLVLGRRTIASPKIAKSPNGVWEWLVFSRRSTLAREELLQNFSWPAWSPALLTCLWRGLLGLLTWLIGCRGLAEELIDLTA